MDGIGGWDGVGEVGVVGDERGGWRKAAPHPGSSPRPEMSLPWFLGKRGNARIEPGFQVQNICVELPLQSGEGWSTCEK